MEKPTQLDAIKELHADLARRWQSKGPQLETLWRSFEPNKRLECLRAATAPASKAGRVLQHSEDTSVGLGRAQLVTPEWNIRDITKKNSDFLLNMIRLRATTSLTEQLRAGANGQAGG